MDQLSSDEITVTKERVVPLSITVGIAIVVLLLGFVIGVRWDWLRSRFDDRIAQQTDLPADLDYADVEEVYDALKTYYDGNLDVNDIKNGLKEGLASATGDPYTVYLSEAESKQFLSDLNGTFTGIGAELGIENELLIIVAPLDGFPAQKAGLRAKDIIASINGEDTFGIKVEEAVTKIRGPKGTDVTLTIIRDSQRFDVTIVRDEIIVPSVTSEVRDGVGILRISRFAEDSVELASAAARSFTEQNINNIILDLRNNSGGYLDGAVKIAGLWLKDKVIVQTKQAGQVVDTQRSSSTATLDGLNTIVLVNEGSASASEIVAGALQDYGAARLLGQTSFGKGSVQELKQFKDGGSLKVTIARWFTPNGRNIDTDGISPDIEVVPSEEDITSGVDTQLESALVQIRQ